MNDRKMNISADAKGIDVDSLIANADPIAANTSSTINDEIVRKKHDKKHTNTKKTPQDPWTTPSAKGKIGMPLYVTPEIKGMIDYLRKETGVPSQVLLRKIIEPAIRKEIKKISSR